jgi:hypothetical protein
MMPRRQKSPKRMLAAWEIRFDRAGNIIIREFVSMERNDGIKEFL